MKPESYAYELANQTQLIKFYRILVTEPDNEYIQSKIYELEMVVSDYRRKRNQIQDFRVGDILVEAKYASSTNTETFLVTKNVDNILTFQSLYTSGFFTVNEKNKKDYVLPKRNR